MECPAEGAGPVLAYFGLLMHAYAQGPGSTPCTTRGGRRIRRPRAFHRAWDVGLRALGEGAFSEETWPTWWKHRFERVPK